MGGLGSPVLGSWLTNGSNRRPTTTPDGLSFTKTGFSVLISEVVPSIIRPPATGFSPGDAWLPVGPGVHAVMIRVMAADATIRARVVRFDFMPLSGSFPNARTSRV